MQSGTFSTRLPAGLFCVASGLIKDVNLNSTVQSLFELLRPFDRRI